MQAPFMKSPSKTKDASPSGAPHKGEPVPPLRAGFVALVGRPNVGKSTLLNGILGEHLSIVSPKPQTTRNRILGVKNLPGVQLALVDTPGLHLTSIKGRTALNRFMVEEAQQAVEGVDAVLLVVNMKVPEGKSIEEVAPSLSSADEQIAEQILGLGKPLVVAINKTDIVPDKRMLLPMIDSLCKKLPGAPIVPISALRGDGIERLIGELTVLLPEGEPLFPEDVLTDRPERFLVSELVREQVFLATQKEIPYAVAVTIDSWQERIADHGKKNGQRIGIQIDATIHVEKAGQKKILVGEGGQMIRQIGTQARAQIAELVGCGVHLALFVRVDEDWSQSPAGLRKMGYESEARR
jgi:GTP-binding protein Era